MHLYEDQFSKIHDFPDSGKPSKVLIIAATERSGSHMLGHALHETRRFGFPLEYANSGNLAEWKALLQIDDLRGIMTELQRRRSSPNGVFGIKLHYPHLREFRGFHNLVKFFPDAFYVLLSRKDVLKQAVSLSIARQTGIWISGQEPVRDTAEYDFDEIEGCLRQIVLNNSSWRYALAASGCKTLEMDFDCVRRDLALSIKNIARFMDVEIDDDLASEQVTQRQSIQRNADWATRFTAEFDKSNELLSDTEPGVVKRVARMVKRLASV